MRNQFKNIYVDIGRKSVKDKMDALWLRKNAVRIQARVRGILEGRYRKIKAKADAEKNRRERAAIKIQCRFRAHRCELDYMLKLQSHRAAIKYENECATKIQKLWRGVLGRRRINDMKGSTLTRWFAWLE